MCIYDDADADAERFGEDDIGGFASDSGQRMKFIHRLRNYAAVFFNQALAAAFDVLGLVVIEARAFDQMLKLLDARPGKVICGAIFFEQVRRDHVDALISALRGEDGGDEQLKWIGEVEFAPEVRIRFPQDADDVSGAGRFGFGGFAGHEEENGARYRVRTCDPYRVKVMLYH